MTPIVDLELSRQLSALCAPPPDNGFEARLRAALRAEAPAAPEAQGRVLRFSARRRRPLVLLAVGTLAFAGAAAAALDGRVWQAIVAATETATTPVPTPATEHRARTRAARSSEPAPAPSLLESGATPSAATAPANPEPAVPPALLEPTTPPTPRTPSERRAPHDTTTRLAGPEATSTRHERPEPPPARSAPASHGIPRLDLGDLPHGNDHPGDTRSSAAPSEHLRDVTRPTHAIESARERATDARERAADRSRNTDRQRRPIDAPALDVERARRGSEARDQEETNREGRTERGRSEREGH